MLKKRTAKPQRKPQRQTGADPTRARLLEASGKVFAERGYFSGTVREICRLAGVNVAAVNYHFGDKLGLYTEVLRLSLRAARPESVFAVRDPSASPEDVLRSVIRARLRSSCQADRPSWHVQIVARELAQPTPAMSRVVNEAMRPMYDRLREIVGEITDLSPDAETTRLCVHSVIGQIVHYSLARPFLVRLWPALTMTPQQLDRIANHIADFSIAYLHSMRDSIGGSVHHAERASALKSNKYRK